MRHCSSNAFKTKMAIAPKNYHIAMKWPIVVITINGCGSI